MTNDYRLETGYAWTGYYFSNDGGSTWGEGLINRTGNLSFANAAGDPVLAFDGSGNAYYSGVAFNTTTNSSSIFVAKSTDGGRTFGDTVILAYSSNSTVSLDKPWMAVNTTNNNIYVAWTEFNSTSWLINFTRSTAGGGTWSSATTISDPTNNHNQASQIAVGPNGEVYVAWEDFNTNRILIDKSTNNGQTFGSDIQVQLITPLNGTLHNTSLRVYSFPTMAVDTSSGSNRGNIYIAWADNRTGDADILFTRSTNGGSSWSTPIRVNNDSSGNGKDQFFPAMSVDPNGKISVIFYDRRDDPSNHDINVYYAESTDGGLSFAINKKINDYAINPDIGFNGSFIGDYIGIASGSGVIHSVWMDTRNGNQDIYTTKALSDWQYNRTLTITGTTAGAQTNYQMKLTVYNSSGADTPGVVYLGGNAKSDFGDIRFTKSDGVTLLDYWIESYTSGVNATVWVEVDYIPASPNTASIYIYYGNPSATSASNIKTAFLIGDDFNDNQIDTSMWIKTQNILTLAETNQMINIYGTTTTQQPDNNIKTTQTVSKNVLVHAKVRKNSATDYFKSYIVIEKDSNNKLGWGMWRWVVTPQDPDALGHWFQINSGTYQENVLDTTNTDLNFHTYEIIYNRSDGSCKLYRDSSLISTKTVSGLANAAVYFRVYGTTRGANSDYNYATTIDVDYDEFFVRSYASPEPTWA